MLISILKSFALSQILMIIEHPEDTSSIQQHILILRMYLVILQVGLSLK